MPIEDTNELEESYTLKLTKTTHPKDVTDDEDKPVKATEKHYDIHSGDKKVGTVVHHHNEYGGHFYNATLHGKKVPFDRHKGSGEGAKAFIDGVAKTAWHSKNIKEEQLEKYTHLSDENDEDGSVEEASKPGVTYVPFAGKPAAIVRTGDGAPHKVFTQDKHGPFYKQRAMAYFKKSTEKTDVKESIAFETLKAGSRPDDNPKSKIEFMTKTLGIMNGMKKEDLSKFYNDVIAQIGKEASALPAGANADANQSSIDMKGGKGPKTKDAMPKLSVREDVEEMFSGEELSEEFKDKASTLFEAAVNARAVVEIARLEEEYETRLEEEVASIVKQVESNLDNYLDYVVENWMKENEVAIESSLRNEIMEEFIGGLKNLFAEHYIEMPEEKIDVVEELAAKVERLEAALDEAINENAELANLVAESARQEAVAEVAEGLTMTQSERFLSLAEGVDFDGDLDSYKKKLSVVKETYFSSAKPQTSNIEEETFEGDVTEKTVSYDPSVNRYVQAISRTIKK